MNEFTKKELISLEHALYTKTEEEKPGLLETSPLLKKLALMIENYVEPDIDIACAFFRMLNYHLEKGDLRLSEIHLGDLLRNE